MSLDQKDADFQFASSNAAGGGTVFGSRWKTRSRASTFGSWPENLGNMLSLRLEKILGLVDENPLWSVGQIGKTPGIACTAARRAVDRLDEADIVSPWGSPDGIGSAAHAQFSPRSTPRRKMKTPQFAATA